MHLLYRKHRFIHGQVKIEERKIKEGNNPQRSWFFFFGSLLFFYNLYIRDSAHFTKLRLNDKWSITATSDLVFSNPHFPIVTDLQSVYGVF